MSPIDEQLTLLQRLPSPVSRLLDDLAAPRAAPDGLLDSHHAEHPDGSVAWASEDVPDRQQPARAASRRSGTA